MLLATNTAQLPACTEGCISLVQYTLNGVFGRCPGRVSLPGFVSWRAGPVVSLDTSWSVQLTYCRDVSWRAGPVVSLDTSWSVQLTYCRDMEQTNVPLIRTLSLLLVEVPFTSDDVSN
jgi:hypothetical protein